MINIVLFDDHEVVLAGLESFFKPKEDIRVVNKASSKTELLQVLANEEECDVLVTDVITDAGDGLDLFAAIQKEYPNEFVRIAYTNIKSPFVHEQLKSYGIDAICSKNKPMDDLYELIKEHYAVGHISKRKKEEPITLTPREREVLIYLEKGLASKEIGKILDISTNTVHNHKQNLLRKYNCSNTIELVSKAIKMGYLKL